MRVQGLEAEEEVALARRIIQAEQGAFDIIDSTAVGRNVLETFTTNVTYRRVRDFQAMQRALVEMGCYRSLKWQTRSANAHLGQAEELRWSLALSADRIVGEQAKKLKYDVPRADLEQEGRIGLLRAAARFDPDRQIRFSTFARWWVRAMMTRYIEQHGRTVPFPGGMLEAFRNLRKVIQRLEAQSFYWDEEAIALELQMKQRDVRKLLVLYESREKSLDDSRPGERSISDKLASGGPLPDDEVDKRRKIKALRRVLRSVDHKVLSVKERHVLIRRYGIQNGEFCTLSVIGEEVNLPPWRVRAAERQALQKLRRHLS